MDTFTRTFQEQLQHKTIGETFFSKRGKLLYFTRRFLGCGRSLCLGQNSHHGNCGKVARPRAGRLELRAHTALVSIRPQRFWGLGLRRGQPQARESSITCLGCCLEDFRDPGTVVYTGCRMLPGGVDMVLTAAANWANPA